MQGYAQLAISKVRGGLPAPGFFDCARRLDRFADRQDARTFHDAELIAVFARWGDWSTADNKDLQMIETLTHPHGGGGLSRPTCGPSKRRKDR